MYSSVKNNTPALYAVWWKPYASLVGTRPEQTGAGEKSYETGSITSER
jgi:hypothetical protein